MANPAEQFIPPGVDRGKVEEIKNSRPTLRVIEGGKSDKTERWSPKEFVDQDKWSPQELTGGTGVAKTSEEYFKQKQADEIQLEALQKAIDTLDESEQLSGKAFPGESRVNLPPMEPVKKMEAGVKPPEPIMELGEEDIEEDLTPTNRIPEMANKPAMDYGDLQPGMEDLPELSAEFLKEDDGEQPTLVKEEGQLPRFKTGADLDKAA
ncbi:MAG: hypothetical protein P1P90_00070 [Patescibacteria group bacterium]|nr:hypothetical protein [Patescibacteria group bacterium]